VIILSIDATVPSIKRAVEAGAVDYLVGGMKYGCCRVCKWKDLYTF
jgi:response regulator of citrate/malate metabolism